MIRNVRVKLGNGRLNKSKMEVVKVNGVTLLVRMPRERDTPLKIAVTRKEAVRLIKEIAEALLESN